MYHWLEWKITQTVMSELDRNVTHFTRIKSDIWCAVTIKQLFSSLQIFSTRWIRIGFPSVMMMKTTHHLLWTCQYSMSPISCSTCNCSPWVLWVKEMVFAKLTLLLTLRYGVLFKTGHYIIGFQVTMLITNYFFYWLDLK